MPAVAQAMAQAQLQMLMSNRLCGTGKASPAMARDALLRHNIMEASRAGGFTASLHRVNKIRTLGKKAEMSGHNPFSKYTIAVIIN
jgi:hypothetical protein